MSGAAEVEIEGNRAYVLYECEVAALTRCLAVVDISNPRAPAVLGRAAHTPVFERATYAIHNDTNTTFRHLRVRGRWAYITETWGGLSVFDVVDPAQPKLAGEGLRGPQRTCLRSTAS